MAGRSPHSAYREADVIKGSLWLSPNVGIILGSVFFFKGVQHFVTLYELCFLDYMPHRFLTREAVPRQCDIEVYMSTVLDCL